MPQFLYYVNIEGHFLASYRASYGNLCRILTIPVSNNSKEKQKYMRNFFKGFRLDAVGDYANKESEEKVLLHLVKESAEKVLQHLEKENKVEGLLDKLVQAVYGTDKIKNI